MDKKRKRWISDWVVSSYEHPLDLSGELFDENMKGLELQQFTGLKDKNGKEIWEGDIIAVIQHDLGGWSVHVRYVVEWDEYKFRLFSTHTSESMSYCDEAEIIGNICENPELLEVK